ncbi:hypothetical protein [Lysobacter hankyongensis]|uniref:Lipoprotein n=1 Tax=Lysobacter hankyongensis TaxID=1176535 RepID=A0ABP9AV24_9GAMM
MAMRPALVVWLVSAGLLAGCANAPASPKPPPQAHVLPPAADAPAMCRMTDPREILLEWAEVPEVRRGRMPASLADTVSPAERAAAPDFDGYRLGTMDYDWVYLEPDRSPAEQRPVRWRVESSGRGFVVTLQPGRNGRLLDDTGPHDVYEFIPDAVQPTIYIFERVSDCWRLTSVARTPQEIER